MNYLKQFNDELKKFNYAQTTINNYSNKLKKFVTHVKGNFNNKKAIQTFIDLYPDSQSKIRTLTVIHFFYTNVLKKKCPYNGKKCEIKKKTPVYLCEHDIQAILNCIPNEKHKLMFTLVYNSGLRISEVVRLKISHIDFTMLKLYIINEQDIKDRYTIFPQELVVPIKNLISKRNHREYLFTHKVNRKYSVRTIQHVFKTAVTKSKIGKAASCRTLRNSFAVELLKNGVDIRQVKSLLGHKTLSATMPYLQIANTHES